MDKFSIQDIENLTGIKAHTLRIWESRYNFITPKRKESNHRYYDGDDLKLLLKITNLYKGGIKLSKINNLSEPEINAIAYNSLYKINNFGQFINQLIEATIEFDHIQFSSILKQCLATLGFEETILKVAYPLLERIGNLWLSDNIKPIQEHFCSTQIRNAIVYATNNLEKNNNPKNHYLLFAPEGEQHEIPLLFIQHLLIKNGNKVTYAGTNVKVKEVKEMQQHLIPTHIWFHLITNLSNQNYDNYLTALMQKMETKILVSGPVANKFEKNELSNLHILQTVQQITEAIKN